MLEAPSGVGDSLIDFGIELTILYCIRSDAPGIPSLLTFAITGQRHSLSKYRNRSQASLFVLFREFLGPEKKRRRAKLVDGSMSFLISTSAIYF